MSETADVLRSSRVASGISISRPPAAASRTTTISADSRLTIPEMLRPSVVRIVVVRYSGEIVFDGSSSDSTRCSLSWETVSGAASPVCDWACGVARLGPSGESPAPAAWQAVHVR